MGQSEHLAYDMPLVSARYARRFVRFMGGKGIGQQTLLDGSGLDDAVLNNPDAFLSMKQVTAILKQADWLVQDERAAFQFGQELNLPAHGLVGYAFLGQRDPKKLIHAIVQYLRVSLPIMDIELTSQGEGMAIRLHDTWRLGPLRAFMSKIYMGSIYALSLPLCRHFIFEFDFPTARPVSDWNALVSDSEMHFDKAHTQVLMPLSGRQVPEDDVGLAYAIARTRLEEQLKSAIHGELVTQVREQIINNPGRGSSLEKIAMRLGMSTRSVRNHLVESGYSFREIRNDIRETFATLYLTDTSVALDVIADKLGFSDQASFTRAYRSWTGKTPGDVRRNGPAQSS
ncbi:MAG: AraC family transcriptional regulator [Alteromonadaceae bacterium]|uniref:AraC family transcriptional regulator n=1 Tax=Marinobacter sp. BGYM27 TaxID=2975597 RepID=UPI000C607D8A|nr:AraC family transcriptional regulator [Marinobacter sp. BGYM27]MAA65345.1 AraC family transcriptional regulator [Alteromonadaceae bacterium]MBH85011.1 AraC family transcriptional regulator [Alteromonadaceae bacterium]MDG5500201.1 AraC family transcriptional regulator ligand-binding domain-containing protein [Marinobacter sp. BGYM27]